VIAETAPRLARLDLPGRPAGIDPADYAPIAED
jgi:cytosine deaminase